MEGEGGGGSSSEKAVQDRHGWRGTELEREKLEYVFSRTDDERRKGVSVKRGRLNLVTIAIHT